MLAARRARATDFINRPRLPRPLAGALRLSIVHLPFPQTRGTTGDAPVDRRDVDRLQCGERLPERPLDLYAGSGAASLMAGRPTLRGRLRDFRARLLDQPPVGSNSFRPPQARGCGIQRSVRRTLPLRLVSELPR